MQGSLLLVVSASSVGAAPGPRVENPIFTRHVLPLLHRHGCSRIECHGSFQGKGGLRLSILGLHPREDHAQLLHGAKRVQPELPDASLLLRKPTLAEQHGGGRRFTRGSADYDLLKRWIQRGAPPDTGSSVRVWIVPPRLALPDPTSTHALQVRATWPDGSTENVTGLVEFRSTAPSEAQVSQDGVARRTGQVGSSAIIAQYGAVSAFAEVLAPAPRGNVARLPIRSPVDEFVGRRLTELNIVPSAAASDREFFRRASLDVLGYLPSRQELARFLADPAPDRRAHRIDEMLQDPRYAWRWANSLAAWTGCDEEDLRHRQAEAGGPPAEQLAYLWLDWLRLRVARDAPYPEVLRGIFLATSREGKSKAAWVQAEQTLWNRLEQGKYDESLYAARPTCDVFWRTKIHSLRPLECAEVVSRRFLGVNLDCARCHDHPYERWLQSEHHALVDVLHRATYMPSPPLRFATKVWLGGGILLGLLVVGGSGALRVGRLLRSSARRQAMYLVMGLGLGAGLTAFAAVCSLYLLRPSLPTEFQSPGLFAASVLEPRGLRGGPVAVAAGLIAAALIGWFAFWVSRRPGWVQIRADDVPQAARSCVRLAAMTVGTTLAVSAVADVGYVVGRYGAGDRRGWIHVVYRRATGGETGEGVRRRWEVFVLDPEPRDRKSVQLPDGTRLHLGQADDRKQLVDWMCDPRNPWVARNFVNRIWAQYFGRGLVEPVDGLGTHPATHPELLDWLAKDFVEHGWSLKHLHRRILNSATYQLSSQPTTTNRADRRHYARFYPRRLSAEHLMQGVDTLTETRSDFGVRLPAVQPSVFQVPLLYPAGERSGARAFRMLWRTPAAGGTLTPEGVLFTLADPDLWRRFGEPGGRVARLLHARTAPDAILDELYESALGRLPDGEERRRTVAHVAGAPSSREGWQDVLWALVNTAEFQFQH